MASTESLSRVNDAISKSQQPLNGSKPTTPPIATPSATASTPPLQKGRYSVMPPVTIVSEHHRSFEVGLKTASGEILPLHTSNDSVPQLPLDATSSISKRSGSNPQLVAKNSLFSKSTSSLRAVKSNAFALSASNLAHMPKTAGVDGFLKASNGSLTASNASKRRVKSLTNINSLEGADGPPRKSLAAGLNSGPDEFYLSKMAQSRRKTQLMHSVPLPRGYSEDVLSALTDANEALGWVVDEFRGWNEEKLRDMQNVLKEAGFELQEPVSPPPPPSEEQSAENEGSSEPADSGAETTGVKSNSAPASVAPASSAPTTAAPRIGSAKKATPSTDPSRSQNTATAPSFTTTGSKPPTTDGQPEANTEDASVSVESAVKPQITKEVFSDPGAPLTPTSVSEYFLSMIPHDLKEKWDTWTTENPTFFNEFIAGRNEKLKIIKEILLEKAAAEEEMEKVETNRKLFPFGGYKQQQLIFDDSSKQDHSGDIPYLSDLAAAELAEKSAGVFHKVRNINIKRTNNGLKTSWLAQPNRLDDINEPGVLEIESEYLSTVIPPGALEPSRIVPPPPRNSMHPFTDVELKLLEHMRSRITFLRNPRFPNIVMPKDAGPLLKGDPLNPTKKFMPAAQSTSSSLCITPSTNGPSFGGSTKQSTKILKSIGGGIVANPSAIYFTDYVPHKTYTKILSIKNKSPHSGRFRLSIPPPYTYSKYFKVTMLATPKPSDGLVAPGMSCQYRVDFTPDSLANFAQTLIVSTEIGGVLAAAAESAGQTSSIPTYPPFSVPIIARRDPPILTIPDVLHCGPCRAGFVATRKWSFNNIGGAGNFLLLTQDEPTDPYEAFESLRIGEETKMAELVMSGKAAAGEVQRVRFTASKMEKVIGKAKKIVEGPFEVGPSYFGLESGESGVITIQFKAKPLEALPVVPSVVEEGLEGVSTGDHRAKSADSNKVAESISDIILRIACDNCQTLELPIRAVVQKPSVRLVKCQKLDAATGEKTALEIRDNLFAFGDQNVKATTTFTVTLHNKTRLKLPYKWIGVDNPGKKLTSGNLEGSVDFSINDSFIFSPATGHLLPNADTTFEVSFNPQEVKQYSVIGRLLLLEEDDRVVYADDGSLEVLPKETDNLRNLECVMDIFCTGVGLPYDVNIKPEIILVPGSLYISQPRETSVRIINNSIADVACEWTLESIDPTIVDVQVSIQRDNTRDSSNKVIVTKRDPPVVVNVTMTGRFPGNVDGALVFKTANGVGPCIRVPLKAKVELAPGALEFDTLLVNFGLMALGSSKTIKVPLVNRSAMVLRWRASGHYRGGSNEDQTLVKSWYLKISPSEGVLDPGAKQMVELTYIPTWYQSFRGTLACATLATTADNATISSVVSCVEMRAEVKTPKACLLNDTNSVTCYVDIPFQWKVVAKNLTMLRSRFEWANPESADVAVQFEPRSAYLDPGEELEVLLEVTFKKVGSFRGISLKCKIDGMVEDDGFMKATLDADVFGMHVNFRILGTAESTSKSIAGGAHIKASLPNKATSAIKAKMSEAGETAAHPLIDSTLWQEGGPYMFDFGYDCPILENRTRTLVIRNKSAIPSPFRVWVETFTAMGIDDKDHDSDNDNFEEGAYNQNQKSSSLEATTTVAAPDSRSVKSKANSKSKKTAESNKSDPKPTKSKLILKPTRKDKIGFSSATGKAWIESIKVARKMMQRMHFLLREGRGAAFHASPSHGIIEPFGEVCINLTSYNNLVGLYEDRFVCEIGKWVRETVPISLGVDGVPVKFTGAQLVATAKKSHGPERLNFGTRVIHLETAPTPATNEEALDEKDDLDGSLDVALNTGYTTKVVQVENQSPRTICLAWKTFVQRHPFSDNASTAASAAITGDVEIQALCTANNLIQPDQVSPVMVSPSPVYVAAFSSTPLEISFRAAETGMYNAVLAAEVGYVQPDGSVSPFPTQGNDLFSPLSSVREKAKQPKPGQVRLLVQAKAIQPTLTLEEGDALYIKRLEVPPNTNTTTTTTTIPTTADPQTPYSNPLTPPTPSTLPSSFNASMAALASQYFLTVLKNNTDASCAFTLTLQPLSLLQIARGETVVGRYTSANAAALLGGNTLLAGNVGGVSPGVLKGGAASTKGDWEVYELHPTESITVAVRYNTLAIRNLLLKDVMAAASKSKSGSSSAGSVKSAKSRGMTSGEGEIGKDGEVGWLLIKFENGTTQRVPIRYEDLKDSA
ncbi:Deleted in lung and esophageal cancer protein 1 [Chytridiales sp. JEL 0842]|nr:Deleted in lung and esophageal cancer protein 1 [Chytridiales sp. JEL 0842]